jgi:hypothetical protein
MTMIAAALFILLSILALCVLSMAVGRRGNTRPHQIAFYAGLAGLFAVPAWLIAFAGIALQIPYIRLASASGALFVACSAILFGASCTCVLALLSIHQGRQRAA